VAGGKGEGTSGPSPGAQRAERPPGGPHGVGDWAAVRPMTQCRVQPHGTWHTDIRVSSTRRVPARGTGGDKTRGHTGAERPFRSFPCVNTLHTRRMEREGRKHRGNTEATQRDTARNRPEVERGTEGAQRRRPESLERRRGAAAAASWWGAQAWALFGRKAGQWRDRGWLRGGGQRGWRGSG